MSTPGQHRQTDAALGALEREIAQISIAIAAVTGWQVEAEERGRTAPSPELSLGELDPNGPLAYLAERAGLPTAAIESLRILACAELDRASSRMLRRLAQDPTRPGIEVDSIVAIAEAAGIPSIEALEAFDEDGPLVSRGLVVWVGRGDGRGEGPHLTRRVSVHPRVLSYLRGHSPGPCREPLATIRRAAELDVLTVRASDVELVRRALTLLDERGIVWIVGPPGVGKRTLLAALCAESARRLMCLGYRALAHRKPPDAAALLWRESLLHDAVICIDRASLDAAEPADTLLELCETIRRSGLPAVWVSEQPPPHVGFHAPVIVVTLALPPVEDRVALWRRELPGCAGLDELAARFQLAPGQIVRAAAAARRLAEDADAVETSHVISAVSAQVSRAIASLGHKIEVAQTWDDVVLPVDTMDAIRELIARARHRHQVLVQWGFGRKLGKGVGLAALFAGPPGTGKTMVSGLIARELDLELYQIDLSRVVSKYIGETEKNLSQIFDAAEGANVMLLFDEADSLFSKRTDVKTSVDRYANLEVNFLLQRMERFSGLSILTTNLEGAIDQAFKRRLAFRVVFPMPDLEERILLWKRMLPAEAHVAGDLDYRELALRYETNGGSIRNGMLRAAYLAAAERSPITMKHVERAMTLEYRDAGVLSTRGRLQLG